MAHIAFDVEDSTLARLHSDPVDFARELRIAAAVKWYEMGIVSQGRAAEISGLSRSEFIDALGTTSHRFGDTLEEGVTLRGGCEPQSPDQVGF